MDDALNGDEPGQRGDDSGQPGRQSEEKTSVPLAESPARHDLLTPRLADPDNRATDPSVCPFFRSIDAHGQLGAPIVGADEANRCAAYGEPTPQSDRQQTLVCLTAAHVDCPRYLQGAVGAVGPSDHAPVAATATARRTLTPAVLVATILLVASAAGSVTFMLARGGLALPVASPAGSAAPGGIALASIGPSGAGATLGPIASIVPSIAPSPAPPTASPTPARSAPPPSPRPTPVPTSNRYALLQPCPSRPNCYIYVVRVGDNLTSIANYFGVPMTAVYRLNPWARTTPLRAGQRLILPPPTR